MYSSKTKLLTVCVLGAVIGVGCSAVPDHSNTLIFGTETKFAIDVGSSSTARMPEVTVGYKRTEAVWLPLLANQKNTTGEFQPAPCVDSNNSVNCKFQSTSTIDAYSVLASFGAKFGGEAGANTNNPETKGEGQSLTEGSAKASGGIAQYFATGLAAQQLAKQGGASLVTVQSGNVKPQKSATEILMDERGLSKEEAEEVLKQATKRLETKQVLVNEVVKRLSDGNKLNKEKINTVGNKLKKHYPNIGSINRMIAATTIQELKEVVSNIASLTSNEGETTPMDLLVSQSFQ